MRVADSRTSYGRRKPVPGGLKTKAKHKVVPSPTDGWILNENLADTHPKGAKVLDNWFPTTTGIRMRFGSRKHATIGAPTAPVQKIWTYTSGATEKMFASSVDRVFEITAPADPNVGSGGVFAGQTSGYYSVVNMNTVGGDFQYIFNGTDNARLYDGTTWQSVSSTSNPISISGVNTANLSFGWVYANRIFMIEKGTNTVWYLPVDSVGGAVADFSFEGIFQSGGELQGGGTWSLDTGDGLDDKFVVWSTTGEVAVYEGIAPDNAATWKKVGVYDITDVLGPSATMQAGGDLLLATEDGLVPLSEAIRKDAAALSLSAVSRAIEPAWKEAALTRRSAPWEILKWPINNMMLVSTPGTTSDVNYSFVANLETGAWCRFTDWDVQCVTLFRNFGYFGTKGGEIFQMEVGGTDDGDAYTCKYVGVQDPFGSLGRQKTSKMARAIFRNKTPFEYKISMNVDYKEELPAVPNSVANFVTDNWDEGLWDFALWDSGDLYSIQSRWVSIGKTGFNFLPQLQITSGTTAAPRVEFVSFDVIYEDGDIAV